MPELTEQDIADMDIDKLGPADMVRLDIKTNEFGLVAVHGYYDHISNKFEVHHVMSIGDVDESIDDLARRALNNNEKQERVRSFIQDNYEYKLVEAYL